MPKSIIELDMEQATLESGNLSQIRDVLLCKLMLGKIKVLINE